MLKMCAPLKAHVKNEKDRLQKETMFANHLSTYLNKLALS